MHEAMTYGASGYISKSVRKAELAQAIRDAMAGIVTLPKGYEMQKPAGKSSSSGDLAQRLGSLTRQQLRVLQMLRQGKLNKQIAHELDVGETTVKAHVSEIFRKLSVASRTQAVIEVSQDRLRRRDGAGTAVGRPSPPRIAVSEARPGGKKSPRYSLNRCWISAQARPANAACATDRSDSGALPPRSRQCGPQSRESPVYPRSTRSAAFSPRRARSRRDRGGNRRG